ncbi:MAG: hypothetical protein QM610_07450 [Chitinophagaceae bacterium]
MKKILKYLLSLIAVVLFQTYSFAQDVATTSGSKSAVDSFMLSNGKIFVVVAVVFLIMLVLFIYMFSLDKKMAKLESRMEK